MKQSAFVFCGFSPRQELFKPKEEERKGGNQSSSDEDEETTITASNMENDFVLVLPGLIIGIECKTTLDKKPVGKAVKQWERLRRVLQEELCLGKEFKFTKCLAYENVERGYEQSEKCPNCAPYLLKWNGENDFKAKFQELIKDVPRKPLGEDQRRQFKDAVRDLLIFTSKKENADDMETRVADAFALRHHQLVNTPAKTAFFWDPEQYDIIREDKKLVLLEGGTL